MNLDEKLEKAAKRMEEYSKQPASREDYKRLLTSCLELGPEGLRKATATWTDAQKEVLKTFLQKAKAPLEMKEAEKQPRNQRDLLSVELDKPKSGHDTEDEELVKPAEVGVRHQGGSGADGAWKGQEIKDPKQGYGRKEVLKSEGEGDKRMDPPIDKGGPGSGPQEGSKKYLNNRKPYMPNPNLKGVHQARLASEPGESSAGYAVQGTGPHARKEHEQKLAELKEMPSPKLGKHVPGVSDKKFDDCVSDVKGQPGSKNAYAICTASLKKGEMCKCEKCMKSLPEDKKDESMKNPQMAPEEMLKHLMKRMDERKIDRKDGVEMLHKMGYGQELLHKMWKDMSNPDAKQDAQMAEKIESIVGQHMEENKGAEKKEAEMKKDFELNEKAPGDKSSPAEKQKMEQKDGMGVEDMDNEKGNPEQDQSKLPAKLGKGEPIPAQPQHEEVPADQDPERLNSEERQSDLPEGKPSGRDGGRMKKSDEEMQKEAAQVQPQHEKAPEGEDPDELNKEEKQSSLPEGKPSGKDGGKMKKSVKWNMKNQLMNQPWTGRNASYKVDAYNEAQEAKRPKKGDFVEGPQRPQTLKKADANQPTKPDWNEIIETKKDLSVNDVNLKKSQIPAGKAGKFTTKSFSDFDLIKSMNLSPEQTKEFLKSEGFDAELVQSQDAKKKAN